MGDSFSELYSCANITHFHLKGCALSLILRVRVFITRNWPLPFCCGWLLITSNSPNSYMGSLWPR